REAGCGVVAFAVCDGVTRPGGLEQRAGNLDTADEQRVAQQNGLRHEDAVFQRSVQAILRLFDHLHAIEQRKGRALLHDSLVNVIIERAPAEQVVVKPRELFFYFPLLVGEPAESVWLPGEEQEPDRRLADLL